MPRITRIFNWKLRWEQPFTWGDIVALVTVAVLLTHGILTLELEFPPEEASRQLETIISWGRYAEILAFDDDDDTLYLEPVGSADVQ